MKPIHHLPLAALALLGTGVSAAVVGMQTARLNSDRSPVQRAAQSGGLETGDVSIRRPVDGLVRGSTAVFPMDFRSIDGTGNHLEHDERGAAHTVFRRLLPGDYADGVHAPAGGERASARAVSSLVSAQSESIPNAEGVTDFVWVWGQFLDHDITETPVADPAEAFDIAVPLGDPWFDPQGLGLATIPLDRSAWVERAGQRQQLNLITAYVDASNVYGSDEERARALRALDGTGRLKTSEDDLLPYNELGLPNAMSTDASFFLAGDIRANEQVILTAMHTLFVREHNHWADALAEAGVSGEEVLYQLARAIVGAEMQVITYREFLPALLGPNPLPAYRGYRPGVDPSIANVFATAAYRVGHTMLSSSLQRLAADGSVHPDGPIALADAFFSPEALTSVGLEPYLRGAASQLAQRIDPLVIDDVRNFLFGPPGAGGFDLVSLNIQRGRDHGLPGYDELRRLSGRDGARGFADVTSDAELQTRLASAYDHVGQMDAWVGLLAEDHVDGALVGPTLYAILADQFTRLRDGDRFWYESYLTPRLARAIEQQTLARIIRRNTDIGDELPDDVFRVR